MLAEHQLENYIHKIKTDGLYAGIIELSLAIIVFNYTIIVYSIEEENIPNNTGKNNSKKTNEEVNHELNIDSSKDEKKIIFKHLTTIEKQKEDYKNTNDIIVLLYDRTIRHFSLVLTNSIEKKVDNKSILEDLRPIDIKKFINKKKFGIKINILNGENYEDLNIFSFLIWNLKT